MYIYLYFIILNTILKCTHQRKVTPLPHVQYVRSCLKFIPSPCHVDQMNDIFSHYELQQMIVMDKFFI